METGVIIALVSLSVLVIINIVAVAYSYGKLSQKVDDWCRKVDRLESMLNDKIGKQ